MFATSSSAVPRRVLAAVGTAAAFMLTLAACGSSGDSSMSGMDHSTTKSSSSASATPSATNMPGMDHMADGNGLADAKDGYRLTSQDTTLPADKQAAYRFTITGRHGKPVSDFAADQTKRMHFYAIRSDLTGFQHIHPAMAADGTWTADLSALAPGSWRMFTSFTPDSGSGKGKALVLSRTLSVAGAEEKTPLPVAASSAEVDGYTVTLKGQPMAGMAHPLTVTVTKDGKPVTDLEPYLNTYAHLTAFHEGDTAFAHLHPRTKVGVAMGARTCPSTLNCPPRGTGGCSCSSRPAERSTPPR